MFKRFFAETFPVSAAHGFSSRERFRRFCKFRTMFAFRQRCEEVRFGRTAKEGGREGGGGEDAEGVQAAPLPSQRRPHKFTAQS